MDNFDQLVQALFPPGLRPDQSLAHLERSLSGPQGQPLFQQLQQNQSRLTQEQMTLLRNFLVRHSAQRQQQQQQQQGQSGRSTPLPLQAGQQPQMSAQQRQLLMMQQQAQQAAQRQPQQPQPAQMQAQPSHGGLASNPQQAQQVINTLRQRVTQIEQVLQREQLSDTDRARLTSELEQQRSNLTRVVSALLSNQQRSQQQQQQRPQQPMQGQQNMTPQQQQAAAAALLQQQQQGLAAQRTGSPLPQANLLQAAAGIQRTGTPGSVGLQANPSQMGGASNAPSPSSQPAVAAAAQRRRLAKEAQQQQQGQQRPGSVAPSAAGTSGAASRPGLSGAMSGASTPITSVPENVPPPRPTLSSGLAGTPTVNSPAIAKPPASFSAQAVQDALRGTGDGAGKKDAAAMAASIGAGGAATAAPADKREDDSAGRTVRKRKVRELVEGIDPDERLDDDVEDVVLEIADEFIDSVVRYGCQLAKHRKSERLEVRDLALHLERAYGMRIPGFGIEGEVRQSVHAPGAAGGGAGSGSAGAGAAGGGAQRSSRLANIPPGYASRLSAVREASKRHHGPSR